jgi:hypothetical protein
MNLGKGLEVQQVPKALLSYQSKIKFAKKENCKYHIQLIEDASKVSELYEVKVFSLTFFFINEIISLKKYLKYSVYQIPLSSKLTFNDNCQCSYACVVLIVAWIFFICIAITTGLVIGFYDRIP